MGGPTARIIEERKEDQETGKSLKIKSSDKRLSAGRSLSNRQ